MKLFRCLAVLALLLGAQTLMRQLSRHHETAEQLADIERRLRLETFRENDLLRQKADLLERSGNLQEALVTYQRTRNAEVAKIAQLRTDIAKLQAEVAGRQRVPGVFAFIVGISQYGGRLGIKNLPGRVDAIGFEAVLRKGVFTREPEFFVYTDERANEASVRSALDTVLRAKAGPSDTVVIFMSALGLSELTPSPRAFLITSDTNAWEKRASGYALSLLQQSWAANPRRPSRVVLFADLCRGGPASAASNNVNAAILEQLSKGSQRMQAILADCEGQPDTPGQMSTFARTLSEGILGRADANGNGAVSLNELHLYVQKGMRAASGGRRGAARLIETDFELTHRTLARTDAPSNLGTFAALPPRWFAQTSLFMALAQTVAVEPPPTFQQQAFTEAGDAFGTAVAAEDLGQNVILQYLLGEQAPQTREDFERGAEYFKVANELNPSLQLTAREAFSRGRVDVFDRNYPQAIAKLSEAIRIEGDAAYAYNALGIAYLEQAQYTPAERNFRDAIQLAPSWPYPRHNLALTYQELGRYREAEAQYLAARSLAPDHAYLDYNLGVLYHRLNRSDRARIMYASALQKNPQLAEAHVGLGALWSAERQFARAEFEYIEALNLNCGLAAARHDLALLYSRHRDDSIRKKALLEWETNLDLRPEFVPSYLSLAEAYLRMKNVGKAESIYRRVLEVRPKLVRAHVALATLVSDRSRDEALGYLRNALDVAPTNSEVLEKLADLIVAADPMEAQRLYKIALKHVYDPKEKRRLKKKVELASGNKYGGNEANAPN